MNARCNSHCSFSTG